MPINNFIKNITSKDINLSKNAIKELIKTCNIEQLKELFSKADFIFPFLIDRISDDFVKLVEENDLKTIFEFSKYYSCAFEDMIVKSFLKFANENLTDEILELFENGTIEQKTYCAKYFYYIQDSLALPFLNKEAKSFDINLKTNCAKTLFKFKDETLLNEAINSILNTEDEFEQIKDYEYICAYSGEKAINFVFENLIKSPFKNVIASLLFDNNDVVTLKNILNIDKLTELLEIVINSIPEDITLSSLYYWNIFELFKIISKNKNQYVNNILYLAKNKLEEYIENDIYSFDLDKNSKEEIKNILNFLKKHEFNFDNLKEEIELYANYENRYLLALEVMKISKNSDCCEFVSELINENLLKQNLIPQSVEFLKEFNKTNLINKENILKIENENIKALILSFM